MATKLRKLRLVLFAQSGVGRDALEGVEVAHVPIQPPIATNRIFH